MIKAMLYTVGDAQVLRPFPFELSKEEFLNTKWDLRKNTEYSDILSQWVFGFVYLVKTVKVGSIHFSDGSCYDIKNTSALSLRWPASDENNAYVNHWHEKLTNKKYMITPTKFFSELQKFFEDNDITIASVMVLTIGEAGFNELKGYDFTVYDPDKDVITVMQSGNTYIFKK